MNKVILMGNLTRDQEIHYSQVKALMAVGRFSLTVNRHFMWEGERMM